MSEDQKPDLFYFNQFVRELMEEKAEIFIYGETYKSSNKELTIKRLLRKSCDFNNDSK